MGSIKKTSGGALAILVASGVLATPGWADELEVEGNVAVVSDYRFRGVSLSDETIALQGGLDLDFGNGFAVGTWGSSIEPVGNSELELDLYGSFSHEFASGLSTEIGVLGYFYPGASDSAYAEFFGSLSGSAGIVGLELGAAYAPEQDNIGGDDNIYVYLAGEVPLGDTPFTLNASLGWEDGAFGDDKIDWLIGITTTVIGLDIGIAYVDTNMDGAGSDGTAVLTLGRSF